MNKQKYLENILANMQISISNYDKTKCWDDWHESNHFSPFTRIYYIIDGCGYIKVDDNYMLPKPGQLILMPQDTYHSFGTIEGKNPFLKYWVHINLLFNGVNLFKYINLPHCINDKNEILKNDFLKLISLKGTVTLTKPLIEKIHATSLISNIISLCPISSITFNEKKTDSNILAILSYIHKNLYSHIEINKLAEHFHYHPNYFYKMFKNHIGISPAKYIMKERISESKKLLTQTDYSITQIANSLCFSDIYHFSKTFKNDTGFSPSNFKKLKNFNQ